MISRTEDLLVKFYRDKHDVVIDGTRPWPQIAVVNYWLPDGTPMTKLISLEQLAHFLDNDGNE